MVRYIANKFFYMLVSLFILISATFFLMKAIPGSPLTSEKQVPPAIKERLVEQLGLDKPVYQQYLKYLGEIAHGDLGISMKQINQDVSHIIGQNVFSVLEAGGRSYRRRVSRRGGAWYAGSAVSSQID